MEITVPECECILNLSKYPEILSLQARISELEAERDKLKELLKEYMETCGTCDFIMMPCDLCAKAKASIGGEGK